MVAHLWFWVLLLATASKAYLHYLPHTDVCSEQTWMGTDTCCPCSGACQGVPSYLSRWGWGCEDMGTDPVCPRNKVYQKGPQGSSVQIPTGGQCCDSCDYECRWTTFQYHYKCCDCPAGYVSSDDLHNCRELYCVGCNDPNETLTGDSVKGFKCIPGLSSAKAVSSSSSTRKSSSTSSVTSSKSFTRSSSKPSTTASSTKSKSSSLSASSSRRSSSLSPTTKPSPVPSTVSGVQCGPPLINSAATDLIKLKEGFVPSPKPDPVGKVTVGYGHKCKKTSCSEVPYKFPLTRESASQLLAKDIKEFEKCITTSVKKSVKLNDNQFGALNSWAYNVGCDAARGSTLIKRLNAGEDPNTIAAQELPRWNKATDKKGNKEPLPGLTDRRAAEVNLFKTPSLKTVLPPLC